MNQCGECGHEVSHHCDGAQCLGSDGCTCTFFRQHTVADEDPNELEQRRAAQALHILDILEQAQANFSIFSPAQLGGRWKARLVPGDGYVSGESLADCLAQLAQSLAI